VGLAVLNYESAYKALPASAIVDLSVTATGNNGSWGVHGRILPFLEEASLYQQVNVNVAWDNQQAISGLRIPPYACPSDGGADEIRDPGDGKAFLYSTTYGFNMGTWFVYDPQTEAGGEGAFFPNSHLRLGAIADGTTKTLMASEVKAWQFYRRNGGPAGTEIPNTPEAAAAMVASAAETKNTGHTEWPDGRVHHTGFTDTLQPNSFVPFDTGEGGIVDADFNSWQEGKNGAAGSPTFAVVTSRSHHEGLVQAVMLDGSVQAFTNDTNLPTWRSLATRAGGDF
jgi:hypothetical protein